MDILLSWTSLGIVAIALVLILIALRIFGHVGFTFRFRGAVSLSPMTEKPCPHLGLVDEPFIHRDEPSEEHRCYLWMQRDRIDLAHQKGFCLSSAHSRCPWLSIAPPVASARVSPELTTGAAASPFSSGAFRAAFGTLRRLLPKIGEGMATAGGRVRVLLPSLAVLAVAAAKMAASGAAAAGLATWHALAVAGHSLYGWSKRTATQTGHRSAGEQEAVPSQSPSALSSAQAVEPEEQPVLAPAAPMASGQPLVVPQPVIRQGASGHLASLIEQGKAASSEGNRQLAYTIFSLALDLEPKDDELWLWKGASAEGAEEKVACFQQALALNPENPRAQQALRQVTQGPWATQVRSREAEVPPALTSMSADALMETAISAMEHGDEDRAYRFFVSATEAGPESDKAWFWRAKTAATLDEVIFCLQQALAINPGNEKVRANLLWAIQRQQREEKVGQPEGIPGQGAGSAPVQLVEEMDEQSPGRSLLAAGFRWLASLTCLALAGYWVVAALQPLFAILALDKVLEDVLAGEPGSQAVYEGLGRWLPNLTWVSLPWHARFEVAAGYNLLAIVPYIVGFLYLFVAIGILRQERWSLFWGLGATVCSLALGTLFSTNSQSAILVVVLGVATVLGLVMGRPGRREEASPPPLVSRRPIDSPYRRMR